MKCSNCGKTNKVVINAKAYCVDCGQPMAAKPHTVKPKQAKAHHAKQHTQKMTKQKTHVLDLSKAVSAKTKPALHAQTIHGVRKGNSAKVPTRTDSALKHAPAQPIKKQAERVLRAQNSVRSAKISKFNPQHLTHYEVSEKTQAYKAEKSMHMSPHETYHLNAKAAPARPNPTQPSTAANPKVNETAAKEPGMVARFLARFSQPRLATVAAVAGCFILLAGYITYLNFPRLQLRVAASQAGIKAELPRYTPAGYGFSGPISTSRGQVTIKFNSHSDGSTLALEQRQTNWDSASLLENYVKPKSSEYLTFQQNGLTIYVYNANQAAWVNSGVLYTLEGGTNLSSEQLIKIATSL